MKNFFKNNRLPIALAVLLHLALILAMILKFSTTYSQFSSPPSQKKTHLIQAKSVSESQVTAQIQAIKKKRYEKKQAALRRKKRLQEKALAIKRAKVAKAKRLARLKRLKKQKALKLVQKKALLAKQKKLQEKLLRQQLKHDQQDLNKVNNQIKQGIIDRYKAQVLSVIQSNWRIQKVNAKLKCAYEVDVAPGGMVLSAKLVKSSGDATLDSSAKVAILKSSPLPVPKDPALFNQFRQFVLTLSPQGYVG